MNEKEKEQPRALCTHDGEEQQSSIIDSFTEFRKWFLAQPGIQRLDFDRREASLMVLWKDDSVCSDVKRKEIIRLLKQRAEACVDFDAFKPNPIFFLQDFPEPKPTFLSGQEQDRLREQGIHLVQVKYNGKFLICTRETMERFGLEWVRDW